MGIDLNATNEFLSGFAAATFFASGLFFLKYWRMAHDRFFLKFFIACELIAVNRLVLLVTHMDSQAIFTSEVERSSWVYLVQLAAYLVIVSAIVSKNRPT